MFTSWKFIPYPKYETIVAARGPVKAAHAGAPPEIKFPAFQRANSPTA